MRRFLDERFLKGAGLPITRRDHLAVVWPSSDQVRRATRKYVCTIRPHKKLILLLAVDLSILVEFQAPESTDQQINRFGLFVSPLELLICQSLDLISTISENNSTISIFGFRAIFWKKSGMYVFTYLPILCACKLEDTSWAIWTKYSFILGAGMPGEELETMVELCFWQYYLYIN